MVETLTKELEQALKDGFRPEVGNVEHIRVLNELDSIEKDKKQLARKKEAAKIARGETALEKRIKEKERRVARQIVNLRSGDKTGD